MRKRGKKETEDAAVAELPPSPESDKPDDDGGDLDSILDFEVAPGEEKPKEEKKSPKEKKAEAEAAKKEEERRIMLKKYPVDVGAIGTVCKAGFDTAAIFGGEHWKLTDEEAKKLDSAWKPVVERFGPEALLKWLPVLGAVIITVTVIAAKVKIGQEIEKKKKEEKAAKVKAQEEAEHQRKLRELDEAGRRAQDAVRGAAAPKVGAGGAGKA
jgi:hypothetical protein